MISLGMIGEVNPVSSPLGSSYDCESKTLKEAAMILVKLVKYIYFISLC